MRLAVLSALVCALVLPGPARAATPVGGFVDTQALGGLSSPTGVAFSPNGRLLVIQQGGALKIQTALGATTSSTLTTLGVCGSSEMGLLGIAADPSIATNGYLYLYRTRNAGDCNSTAGRFNEVVRVTLGPGDTVSAGSLVTLLGNIGTGATGTHNGGGIRVGTDGLLYIGVGDQNPGRGDPNNPAQNLNSLSGKVLRIGRDGAIPAANPFVGQAGRRPEIFAYGFRNPWRSGIDPANGRLWVGDVGDAAFEEIDLVPAGGNHSWPACEGKDPPGCAQPGDVIPVFTYPRTGAGSIGQAVTGGGFAPAGFGAFGGQYFFSDLAGGRIVRVPLNGARTAFAATPTDFVTNTYGVVDLVFGPDGAMYYTLYGGEVRRVAPTGTPTTTTSSTLAPTTTSTTRTTTTTSTTRTTTTSTTRTTTTTLRRTTTSTTRPITTSTSSTSSSTATSVTSSTTPLPPTTTTTLPGLCGSSAEADPAGVRCVAEHIRETLAETVEPACGTCRCTPRPTAARALRFVDEALAATSRGRCRSKVAAVKAAARTLERQVRKLVQRGCPRSTIGGQALASAAQELGVRARALAQSEYCTQK